MRNREWYKKHKWRLTNGFPERELGGITYLVQELRETQWSKPFEELMRSRLILGATRYGRIKEPGKPKYDRVESMHKRLEIYKETGNKEYLVDIANLCLLEFEECHHPLAHFDSVDDGEHVKVI